MSVYDSIFPINYDCRHYIGEKPCKFKRHCPGCEHFEAFGTRILIIKLGALGDVLRTTPLLPALKAQYPESHITWVIKPSGVDLLKGNPYIDRILPLGWETTLRLQHETFDRVYNFDKEIGATGLMMSARTPVKVGFGIDERGALIALNPESEYGLALGVSDPLKFFESTKTYQDVTFEMCGLKFQGEEYLLPLTETEAARSRELRTQWGVGEGEVLVGFNTGAGDIFATKRLSPDLTCRMAGEIVLQGWGKVALLGGPLEVERNSLLSLEGSTPWIDTGCDNPLREFFSVVNACDVLVAVDTLAMHVGIAFKKQVLAFFGPTCDQEVTLYGRGAMLKTAHECSPCYRQKCPYYDYCMDDIPWENVKAALKNLITATQAGVSVHGIPKRA